MNNTNAIACTICEEEHLGNDGWFLLTENESMDRLKILAWDDLLATQGGVHCLCSTAHVQELVAHWMATGSLQYPFARLPFGRKARKRQRAPLSIGQIRAFDSPSAKIIGELAVHRESLKRVLNENPHSLVTILDALLGALRHGETWPDPVPPAAELAGCHIEEKV